jgi:hypothetical protein
LKKTPGFYIIIYKKTMEVNQVSYEFDAFISYSREDKDRVEDIVKALEKKGVRVWWDKNIKPGGRVIDEVQCAIEKCKTFLPVISEASLRSSWVENEINMALQTSFDGNYELRIIPVRLGGGEIRGFLRTYNWIDFTDNQDYLLNIAKLVMGIKGEPVTIISPTDADQSFSLNEILQRAEKSVIISGNTLNKFTSNRNVRMALQQLLTDGKKVTLILLNPYCS